MVKSSKNWLYYAVVAGVAFIALVLFAIGSLYPAKAGTVDSIRTFYQHAHDLGTGVGGLVYQSDDTDTGEEPVEEPVEEPSE
jgi:hypothetical protein